MQHSQQRSSGRPRRILLRWLGLYFMLLSLIVIASGLVLLGSGDGALAGFGNAAIAILLLAALLNFGLGFLGLLFSFWGRRTDSAKVENRPRRRGLWFLGQALLGLLGATLLYGLSGVASLLVVVFVVSNWAYWWYGSQMPQVQIGDSRQRVEQLVGQGSFSAECSSPYAKDYSRSTDLSRCASVTLYYEYDRVGWEIAYDAQDRVVSKLRVQP